MERRSVELRIAGKSYKVISSAPEAELLRLADVVNAKIAEMMPADRAVSPQAILLAAMALAHDLEQERDRRLTLERRSRDMLRRVLVRIEDALDSGDEREYQEPS
jgi:cell division protein ZapA